jgi:ClpP class serine protease
MLLQSIINQHHWAIRPDAMEQFMADVAGFERTPGQPMEKTRTVTLHGSVAVVPVTGILLPYANWFSDYVGWATVGQLALDLQQAVANPDVTAIVLMCDSPGGVVTGISDLAKQILEARSAKPVVAMVQGMACSAAYWLASAASEVVTSDTGVSGSIGTVVSYPVRDSQYSVELVSKKSPKKRPNPKTESGKAQIIAELDAITDVFIGDVARHRGVTSQTVEADFGQGDVFVGQYGVTAGLADRVGTLDALLTELQTGQKLAKPAVNKPKSITINRDERNASMDWMTITAADIEKNRADLVMGLTQKATAEATQKGFEDGKAAGLTEGKALGATAERDRIQGVMGAGLPGHDDLIKQMAFDGKSTPGDAALAVNKAERETSASKLANIQLNSPPPVEPESDTPQATKPGTPDAWKAEWEKSVALQKEMDCEGYVAFKQAEANGQAKIREVK